MGHYHNGDLHIEDGLVHMRGNGLHVPPDERQAAAQAIAGDGWRVVPADVRHGCGYVDDQPCGVCGDYVAEWERELLAQQAAESERAELDEDLQALAEQTGRALAEMVLAITRGTKSNAR